MKYFISIWLGLTSLIFTGCDSESVSLIKNTTYSNGMSIGSIFERSSYCDSVEWSDIPSKPKKQLVQVKCEVASQQLKLSKYFVFTFKNTNGNIDFENSFWSNDGSKILESKLSNWQTEIAMEEIVNAI